MQFASERQCPDLTPPNLFPPATGGHHLRIVQGSLHAADIDLSEVVDSYCLPRPATGGGMVARTEGAPSLRVLCARGVGFLKVVSLGIFATAQKANQKIRPIRVKA